MSDYLSTALTIRAAIEPLMTLAQEKEGVEFPYEQVRQAVGALIGTSRTEGPSYDVLIRQRRHAMTWLTLLASMESDMLNCHRHKEI